MLLSNGRIGDVLQVENGFDLNQVEIDIGRKSAPDVLLANLPLSSGLINGIIRMAAIHKQLENEDSKSEEIIVRGAVHILKTRPHEPGRSEVVLAHRAAEYLAGRGVGRLHRVEVDHEEAAVGSDEEVRVVDIADHIVDRVQVAERHTEVAGNAEEFMSAESNPACSFQISPGRGDAESYKLVELVKGNLGHKVPPRDVLLVKQRVGRPGEFDCGAGLFRQARRMPQEDVKLVGLAFAGFSP